MTFAKADSFITFKHKVGRRLKPTDPDFVAPDGGWGWIVAFACGLSTLCIYSMLQQFGLVFTDKFHKLGITHTQTTTIININLALTSCIGLFNGPIYRRFSFRQVGLFGSSMVICSLVIITCCNSFWSFLVVYGLMFGTSIGLTLSANSLALNTYFKEKRSVATGFSWGITGIGPIVWPYVITILMDHFGSEGTVLLFAGFSSHAFLCALLLQPVHWHTKRREDTEVPLMPLRPKNTIVRMNSETHSILDELAIEISRSINGKINEYTSASTEVIKNFLHDRQHDSHKTEVPFMKQDSVISNNVFKISSNLPKEKTVDPKPETGLCKQLITFFDLDIMKDLVYLNIIFGMISINFVEWNTTILTPGILKEFKFEKFQVATYMSLLAVTDVTVRFCIPFVARKLQWNNRVFYLLGAALTTTGRMAVLHTQQFHISLCMAVLVGIGRGLCIVYLALLIPTHVSLKKLPAALGIYLSFFGLFLILMAPVVGWIRDTSHSYVTTIHVLNILIYVAAISWILEYLTKRHKLNAKIQDVST